jgi:SAM-dependent methyltransferase
VDARPPDDALPAVTAVAIAADGQREIWDAVAAGWRRWQRRFEAAARVVTERLVSVVAAGDAVLDVGSGCGEPALSAARATGAGGRVLGVDVSPQMIAVARRAAAGLANVEFVEADIERAPLPAASFDVALARWSLPFAGDRVVALRAVHRSLVPGGVLAAAVWGPPAEAPAISLAFRTIAAELGLEPPPPGPGPFALADADLLAAELRAAGFVEAAVERVVVPFRFASVDELARFARDVLPPGIRSVLRERRGSVDDPAVWDAFAAAAAAYRRPDGSVVLPSLSLCVRAGAGVAL